MMNRCCCCYSTTVCKHRQTFSNPYITVTANTEIKKKYYSTSTSLVACSLVWPFTLTEKHTYLAASSPRMLTKAKSKEVLQDQATGSDYFHSLALNGNY